MAATPPPSTPVSPCQSCGACCAHYRVSFYWQEAEQRGLDVGRLVQVTPLRVCFQGTDTPPSRCVHLAGEVGSCASCTIYDQRPTPCREVQTGDEKCLRAREAHGLGPL